MSDKTLKDMLKGKARERFLRWTKREDCEWIRDLKEGDEVWTGGFVHSMRGIPQKMYVAPAGVYVPGDRCEPRACGCPCPEHSKLTPPVMVTMEYNWTTVGIRVSGEKGSYCSVWTGPHTIYPSEEAAWQGWADHHGDPKRESIPEYHKRMMKNEKEAHERSVKRHKEEIKTYYNNVRKAKRRGAVWPAKRDKDEDPVFGRAGDSAFTC